MRKLLLLTGIPGTGKTTMGDYLRDKHGFLHIDVEYYLTNRIADKLNRDLQAALEACSEIVVTWGFLPVDNVPQIRSLITTGFRLIWFDGDRTAALREFNKRGTVTEDLFRLQVKNIDASCVIEQLRPRIINPFDKAGEFKPKAAIAADILE